MADVPVIETDRLRLRGWGDDDREPFAAINADSEVARFLGAPLTREQSDALVDRIISGWDVHGFGLWAVQPKELDTCVGFVGLWVPSISAPFMPCVEIGWRLGRDVWGRGYVPEAARATLAFAFERLMLDEVVSMTARENQKSRRVMEKLGLTYDPTDDFEHPNLRSGDPLRDHVLYRLRVRNSGGWSARSDLQLSAGVSSRPRRPNQSASRPTPAAKQPITMAR